MIDIHTLYLICLYFIFIISAFSFPILFFFTAPYGRHARKGWGPEMNYTLGWYIMEIPPPLIFAFVFFLGTNCSAPVPLIFLGIWSSHYFYRSVIFPYLIGRKNKLKPIAAVVTGFIFNMINGFINAYAISSLADHLTDTAWLGDPRFIIGIILMATGFSINFQSDAILRKLRKPGEKDYKIPYGGLYRWISSPNYLGEIIEWTGLALATWTLAGLSFAVFTIANLFPRAISHHRWYNEQFEEYPKDRKAIIPFIV